MMAKSVSMEEVRAYVMIRQSQLSSEDRKRIVVETEGNLTYAGAALSTAVFSPYSHARFSGQTYHSRCHIGMHVDDGIGVGTITIWKSLGDSGRSILLGAFNIMEFDFCGIRYRQMEDGSTEMFQRRYVEQIDTKSNPSKFWNIDARNLKLLSPSKSGSVWDRSAVPCSMQQSRPGQISVPKLDFSNRQFEGHALKIYWKPIEIEFFWRPKLIQ